MYSSEVLAAVLGLPCPTVEQQKIIESPLTPAVVVAGAGSGKTETMSARVVYLVANELAHPQQILGLTFTRKAANELSERIEHRINSLREIKKLGLLKKSAEIFADGGFDVLNEQRLKKEFPDAAKRRHEKIKLLQAIAKQWDCVAEDDVDATRLDLGDPEVSTYNSFADSIVRSHGIHIGLNPEAQVQSEANAWLLMREIVLESDDARLAESAWKLNTVIERALELAGQLDDNLVSLERLRAFPQEFAKIQNLPSATKRSALLAFIKADVERINALLWLADLVEIYRKRKAELGLIDFSDQLLCAYRIISDNDHLAQQMRRQYRVVLLDEYQDTSVVQTKLLSKIFAEHPVMAVGDTNQAIYTWRGASANNLDEFPSDFAPRGGCLFLTLSMSWRNDRQILKAANALIAAIPDTEKPLAAQSDALLTELKPAPVAGDGSVDLIWAADIYQESSELARWFEERLTADKTAAVLFRTRSQMRFFEEALAKTGLPYQTIGRGGLLSAPEIVDIVCALKVIHDPGAGSELVRLLAGPRWQISLSDLKKLLSGATKLNKALEAAAASSTSPDSDHPSRIIKDPDAAVTLYDALIIYSQLAEDAKAQTSFFAELSDAAKERLREAASVFLRITKASSFGLAELVDEITRELRIDIELIANETRASASLALRNLKLFKAEIRQFAALREDGGVTDLLDWLDFISENDSFTVASEEAEAGVIQLMTVHAAKGLEWDLVAVPRMFEGGLPSKAKTVSGWLSSGLPYPFRGDAKSLPAYRFDHPEVASQQELQKERKSFQEAERNYHLAEERRLAYVAVTRAREQLLLSGHNTSLNGASQTVSRYLDTVSDALGLEIPEAVAPEGEQKSDPSSHWPRDPLGNRRHDVNAAAELLTQSNVPITGEANIRKELPRELQLLLLESESNAFEVLLPQRIAASSLHDFREDYQAALRSYLRPMPSRPYRQSRLGTIFHNWVEQRSQGQRQLDDQLFDNDFMTASHSKTDDLKTLDEGEQARFEDLKQKFLRSQWAELKPLWVEHEIQFVDTSLSDQPHIIVCKMDAVYRRGDRIEIVDWKTGKAPQSEAERSSKLVQLEVYREAYHRHYGVPIEQIDVVLFYVDSEVIIRA